ncbi:MAG: hypothetical protein K2W96_05120 [Gemmataceae bacterium]|nr:hypothetical protein [Gemmataceae bacterium]
MRVVGEYSFKDGKKQVAKRFPMLLAELHEAIKAIDAGSHRTKMSREKTMHSRMLYNPRTLNAAFKRELYKRDWNTKKLDCEYSSAFYVEDYAPTVFVGQKPYREMDFVKREGPDKPALGVEVQFGKYAFMVYNVCAKMTIFHNKGEIECGVEIVPVRGFTRDMSTGVAYFEQFVWDLEARGSGDIDIPVLVLGIDADILLEVEKEAGAAKVSPDEVQPAKPKRRTRKA